MTTTPMWERIKTFFAALFNRLDDADLAERYAQAAYKGFEGAADLLTKAADIQDAVAATALAAADDAREVADFLETKAINTQDAADSNRALAETIREFAAN